MDDLVVKFGGTFILQDTDLNVDHTIPIQVAYSQVHKKHLIIVYEYLSTVLPPMMEAILTGVITHFDLDRSTTSCLTMDCHLLGSKEEEPENTVLHHVTFVWKNDAAHVIKIKKGVVNDSSTSS